MPETYKFVGDATTVFGLVGFISTIVVVVFAYRRYWNSPYIK